MSAALTPAATWRPEPRRTHPCWFSGPLRLKSVERVGGLGAAGRGFRSAGTAHVEQSLLRAVKPHGGKAARTPSLGVDADAPGQPFRLSCRRVSVDDHIRAWVLRAEEKVADPQKVGLALRLQRPSRPHAGVYEQVVALDVVGRRGGQQGGVDRRQACG